MQDSSIINVAIVARIRKLMNLSKNDAASDNEREQSAAHAQRLMMDHNISLATVEASQDTSTIIRRMKQARKGYAQYDWQRTLMSSVATVNFAMVTTDFEWKKRRWYRTGFELVGREENVIGASVMFDYLRSTVERLARNHVGGDHLKLMTKKAMSFKTGCAEQLTQRLLERHRAALAEQKATANAARQASGGTALVVIMEDYAEQERCANEDFRCGLPPGTTAHNKFIAKRKNEAWGAAREILQREEFKGVDDEAMLNQAIVEAIFVKIAGAGLTDKELSEVVAYGRDDQVRAHIANARGVKPKGRRGGGRHYRSYSRQDRTDWSAHSAGSEAGKSVNLDKQVDRRAAHKAIES